MPQHYVNIDLDKPRKLRFRHNDLGDLELQSGKGVGELMTGMSFHGMRLLLSYGLRWQDSKMSNTKAGDLIDVWIEKDGTLASLMEKLMEAMRIAGFWTGPGTEEEPEGNAPAEGTTP